MLRQAQQDQTTKLILLPHNYFAFEAIINKTVKFISNENTDRKFCFYEKIVESLSTERVRKIITFRRLIKLK